METAEEASAVATSIDDRASVDDDRSSSLASLLVRADQMLNRSTASSSTQNSETATTPPPSATTATTAAVPAPIPGNVKTSTSSPTKKKRRPYRKEYPASFWYEMCEKFTNDPDRYQKSQLNFLKSADSGVLGFADRQAFGKRLKAFKEGNLPSDDSIKRNRKGKYQDVERCLLAFLETRDQFTDKGKISISWPFLTEMAKRFSVALGHGPDEFSASPGWLANVLRRSKKKIDFEATEEDALFYLESIKRYCRKAKLGAQAQNLTAQLQNIIKKKNELPANKDHGSSNAEETEVPRVEPGFPRPVPNNSILMPRAAGNLPMAAVPFVLAGAVRGGAVVANTGQNELFQPTMANFAFWATQQQNI